MKVVKNNQKKLAEELSRINRLFENQIIFSEKKSLLTEENLTFKFEDFISRVIKKSIPKENKVAWSILDGLSMKTVNGVLWDNIGGVVKNIFVKNMNHVQLKSLMRIPEIRQALEEYFAHIKFRPNEPEYSYKIDDALLQSAIPESNFGKIIKAYLDTKNDILKATTTAAKEKNYYLNKYNAFAGVADWFKKWASTSLWINRYKTFDTPEAVAKMDKLLDETKQIADEYESALLNGNTAKNHVAYQKELTEKLRKLETYHESMQRDFYKRLLKEMPESVKKELGAKADANAATHDELAKIWKHLTDNDKIVNDVERKYIYLFKGYGKAFGGGWGNFFKRFGTWLVSADARLAADFANNIKAKGRFGVIWREAFVRAATLSLAYGFIDYLEAYYLNQKGKPFQIGNTKFQPNQTWGGPEKFEGDWEDGALYFVKHIGSVAVSQFYKNPIATFTDGVAVKLAKKFWADPENQEKKNELKQELYKEQWESFWESRKTFPDYQNASPVQKIEIEKNITDSFQTAFLSASNARKSLDSLDK